MRKLLCLLFVGLIPMIGCRALDLEDDDEEEVPVAKVPAPAMRAAQAAVPGLKVTHAEREVEDGVTVYDLEGTANGRPVEVEVTADGKVLEVEEDGEDEKDDDDDDDDDDEEEEEEED